MQMNSEIENSMRSSKNEEKKKTGNVSLSRDTIRNSNAYSQQSSQSWLNYEIQNKAKKLYIKSFKSSPIDIEFSYVTKILTDDGEQANKQFSFKEKVKNYGLNLVNLDRVSIRINSLALVNIFGTSEEIIFQL